MKQFGVKKIGVNALSVKQIGVNSLLVLLALLSAVAAPARAMELQKVGEALIELFILPV